MKKLSAVVPLILLLAGLASLFIGLRYGIPIFNGLGMASASALLALKGGENIRTRKYIQRDEFGTAIIGVYRGAGAVFNGIFWLILAALLFLGAIAVMLGRGNDLLDWLKENPATGVIAGGLMAAAVGGQNLAGSDLTKRSGITGLLQRGFGLLMLLLGFALLAGGILITRSPELIDNLISRAARTEWYGAMCWAGIDCLGR